MSFERIVRPFQLGVIFDARVAPVQPTPPTPPADAVLTITGSANASWTEAPNPTFLGFKVEWIQDPARTSLNPPFKVVNPQDDSQFVEVQTIKQATFRNNRTGEEMTLTMIDPNRTQLGGDRTG